MASANAAAGGATLGQTNPVAFWLSVAGLGIQMLAVLMTVTMYSVFSGFGAGMFGMMGYYGGMMGPYYGPGAYGAGWLWLVFALVAVAVGAVGVILMNSNDSRKFRNGAVLVLLAAVFAFPTMWGFWIGSILMFIGALMGLTTQAQLRGNPA